jgi:hypothetical protein
MFGDYPMGQREPDAMAFLFGREKGNEDTLEIRLRNPFTRVFNLDDGPIMAAAINLSQTA